MASGDNFRGRALGKSGFANIRTPANPNKRTNRNNTNARNAQDLNKQLEQSVPRTTQADIPVTAAELSRQITTDAARVIRPVEPIEVLDLEQTLDLTEQRNETKDAFPFNDGGSSRKSAIALEESAQEENDDGVARARVDFQETAQTAVRNLFAPVREEGNGLGWDQVKPMFTIQSAAKGTTNVETNQIERYTSNGFLEDDDGLHMNISFANLIVNNYLLSAFNANAALSAAGVFGTGGAPPAQAALPDLHAGGRYGVGVIATSDGDGNCPQLALHTNNSSYDNSANTWQDRDFGILTFTYFVPTGSPLAGGYWQLGTSSAGGSPLAFNLSGEEIVAGAWTTTTIKYGPQYSGTDTQKSARFLWPSVEQIIPNDGTGTRIEWNYNADPELNSWYAISEYKLADTIGVDDFLRNPNFFGNSIDNVTAAVAWNSRRGHLISATPITPRHVISTEHASYHPRVGDILTFVTRETYELPGTPITYPSKTRNVTITRRVLREFGFGNYEGATPPWAEGTQPRGSQRMDLSICLLDEDLPPSVGMMKLVPPGSEFSNYFKTQPGAGTIRERPDGFRLTYDTRTVLDANQIAYPIPIETFGVRLDDVSANPTQELTCVSLLTRQDEGAAIVLNDTITNAGDPIMSQSFRPAGTSFVVDSKVNFRQSSDPELLEYFDGVIEGDSGSPTSILIDNECVLFGLFTGGGSPGVGGDGGGGAGGGPTFTSALVHNTINEAIKQIDEQQEIYTGFSVTPYSSMSQRFINYDIGTEKPVTNFNLNLITQSDENVPVGGFGDMQTVNITTTSFEIEYTTFNNGVIKQISLHDVEETEEERNFFRQIGPNGVFPTMRDDWYDAAYSDKFSSIAAGDALNGSLFRRGANSTRLVNGQSIPGEPDTLDWYMGKPITDTFVSGEAELIAKQENTRNKTTKFTYCVPPGTTGTYNAKVSAYIPQYLQGELFLYQTNPTNVPGLPPGLPIDILRLRHPANSYFTLQPSIVIPFEDAAFMANEIVFLKVVGFFADGTGGTILPNTGQFTLISDDQVETPTGAAVRSDGIYLKPRDAGYNPTNQTSTFTTDVKVECNPLITQDFTITSFFIPEEQINPNLFKENAQSRKTNVFYSLAPQTDAGMYVYYVEKFRKLLEGISQTIEVQPSFRFLNKDNTPMLARLSYPGVDATSTITYAIANESSAYGYTEAVTIQASGPNPGPGKPGQRTVDFKIDMVGGSVNTPGGDSTPRATKITGISISSGTGTIIKKSPLPVNDTFNGTLVGLTDAPIGLYSETENTVINVYVEAGRG